jgi:hypothetical protein
MKEIDQIRIKLENVYSKRYCQCDNVSFCLTPNACQCKVLAEVMAYVYGVIPDPYFKYTIHDFDGRRHGDDKDDERILDETIALNAKKKIIEYCWEGLSIDKVIIEEDLDKYSSINKRRQEGKNVVIYGDDEEYFSSTNGKIRQKGRTLTASLIMKEIIRRRVEPKNQVQTYDWVSFPMLEYYLKQKDGNMVFSLSACDWLCVDDIPKKVNDSKAANAYRTSLLDPFFLERLESGLPTIFVFRFNITSLSIPWEECFGIGINRIINDPKTCIISLCSPKDNSL